MALLVTHTTAADGTFSSAGATAWNATHAIAGTLDLATETTGSLDLITRSTGSLDLATRTTGSLDLTARSTGTIDLLTQTRGATATQLMYGGPSGQVAQNSQLVWSANDQLLINQASPSDTTSKLHVGGVAVFDNELRVDGAELTRRTVGELALYGHNTVSGTGGNVRLQAGNGGGSDNGGAVILLGGQAAGSPNRLGGAFNMFGGDASFIDTSGVGGGASIVGGAGYNAGSVGGLIIIEAGQGVSGANGATAILRGGYTDSGTPGDVSLQPGQDPGSGVPGNIRIENPGGNDVAVTAGTGTTHAKDLPVIVDGVQYYIQLYS